MGLDEFLGSVFRWLFLSNAMQTFLVILAVLLVALFIWRVSPSGQEWAASFTAEREAEARAQRASARRAAEPEPRRLSNR